MELSDLILVPVNVNTPDVVWTSLLLMFLIAAAAVIASSNVFLSTSLMPFCVILDSEYLIGRYALLAGRYFPCQ